MATFDVTLYEPISAVVTADNLAPTVDSLTPTADGGILEGANDFNDALVGAHFISGDIYEPVTTAVTADTTAYTADNTVWPTADGGLLIGAADVTDAEVIPVSVAVGGGYYPPLRPFPVEGVGYGVLPELEGEGFGTIVVAGDGVGTLPKLAGKAAGTIGVAGRSAAQVVIRAVAIGDRGQIGTAVAVLKGLSVASNGAIGVRGSGSGAIVKLKGAGIGRHDDDDAAVITFLLAA